MDQTERTIATKVLEAAEKVEGFRRCVNEEHSQAPAALDTDFRSAVDQLADHQYKLIQIVRELLIQSQSGGVEERAAQVVEDAQRETLSVLRALAEARKEEAESIERELHKVQADVTELLERKEAHDRAFQRASQFHESNDSAALKALRDAAAEYREFVQHANAKIAGTRRITKRERTRQRLVWMGAITGTIALVIALVGRDTLLAATSWLWTSITGH